MSKTVDVNFLGQMPSETNKGIYELVFHNETKKETVVKNVMEANGDLCGDVIHDSTTYGYGRWRYIITLPINPLNLHKLITSFLGTW